MNNTVIKRFLKNLKTRHRPLRGGMDLLKYIGPGLLVTVGFIDPGNWASNLAAGSNFGYTLLWVITFSSIMLIVLQHNVAHLGIVTGLCLSEATVKYLPKKVSRPVLTSAMLASASTSLAEILGGAIALQMLFGIPPKIGALIVAVVCGFMLFTHTYSKIEKWIITFVSIIGLSFLYELTLVHINWGEAAIGWVKPSFPNGSMILIMSVLGAIVMPHNLFLHSEIIQSRQWNLENETLIKKQLKYEFFDTLLSMGIGWAINSAMILLAASVFFQSHTPVEELQQAQELLTPLVGKNAGIIFAVALLFAGISSTITSGIAGGSIFAGFWKEPFHVGDIHSKIGVLTSYVLALIIIFLIKDPFQGLILSQMFLSVQLPITVFTQVYLTSSERVMGKYANSSSTFIILIAIGVFVTILNIYLLIDLLLH